MPRISTSPFHRVARICARIVALLSVLLPVATIAASPSTSVWLTWRDNSNNKTAFEVRALSRFGE